MAELGGDLERVWRPASHERKERRIEEIERSR
jgi:hypothetical protein